MGPESDQIKRHIEAKRNELGTHLGELEYRVKAATDWRMQVKRRPKQAIAAAFSLGMLVAFFISIRS